MGDDDSDVAPQEAYCTKHTKRVKWGSVQIVSCDEGVERLDRMPCGLRAPPGLEAPSTLVLQKLPKTLDRASLLAFLDMQGFRGHYDFLYLPLNYKSGLSLGFAFVNFVSNAAAKCAMDRFSSMFEVKWSQKRRGLQENIEYYQNTALMSPDMPDEFKPILLVNGLRVDFPGAGCKNDGKTCISLMNALP